MAEPAVDPVDPVDPPVDPAPIDPPADPPANAWPDTWREQYAGEDESKLAHLSRYASPAAAFDGLIATKTKISSGEFRSTAPFPEDGTDEQKAAWREENGIPTAADKYELSIEGEKLEGEKEAIDELLAMAYENNLPPKAANTAAEWYLKTKEKEEEARIEQDAEVKSASEDALRVEWGNEYRANVNRIHGLLDMAPEGVKDKILNARFPDGTPFGSDPDSLKFLIDLAVQINPVTTLVPGAGDNIAGAVSDEIKTLEGMMGNKGSEYWKGPKAEDNQKRLRELYRAQERMK